MFVLTATDRADVFTVSSSDVFGTIVHVDGAPYRLDTVRQHDSGNVSVVLSRVRRSDFAPFARPVTLHAMTSDLSDVVASDITDALIDVYTALAAPHRAQVTYVDTLEEWENVLLADLPVATASEPIGPMVVVESAPVSLVKSLGTSAPELSQGLLSDIWAFVPVRDAYNSLRSDLTVDDSAVSIPEQLAAIGIPTVSLVKDIGRHRYSVSMVKAYAPVAEWSGRVAQHVRDANDHRAVAQSTASRISIILWQFLRDNGSVFAMSTRERRQARQSHAARTYV